jgi:hypothetical protein
MADLPAEPMSQMEEGLVSLHEMYRKMRASGWPIVAACAYLAVFARINTEDPPQP